MCIPPLVEVFIGESRLHVIKTQVQGEMLKNWVLTNKNHLEVMLEKMVESKLKD